MDLHFIIIVITMFVMGILGGIINYYINGSSKDNNTNNEMIKVIVIGIEQEGLEEKIIDDTDDMRILKALANSRYTYIVSSWAVH